MVHIMYHRKIACGKHQPRMCTVQMAKLGNIYDKIRKYVENMGKNRS